jgi:hypothetical protein
MQHNPQHIVRPKESLQTLKHDITRLSGQIDQMTPSYAVMEAVCSAKYSLIVAIASMEGTSVLLSHKDVIAPNQHSWPETAKQMGVKQVSKRKWLPEEYGLTDRSIGVTKGKQWQIHQDPYAGGK